MSTLINDRETLMSARHFINKAFVWASSPQGYIYWRSVYYNLGEILKERQAVKITDIAIGEKFTIGNPDSDVILTRIRNPKGSTGRWAMVESTCQPVSVDETKVCYLKIYQATSQ